ncbi:MAG: hypothetical protein ISS28_06980 [Candidatus Cloacimonetes bacterium]|nr:hypothetical protein [Candidatus Cloacimonadota bacterium]
MDRKIVLITIILILPILLFSKPKKDMSIIAQNNFTLTEIGSLKSNIGLVTKLFLNSQNNFVSFNVYENKLLEFDRDGKILKEIGGKGKGPGEFQSIYGFSKSDDNFYVCDYVNWRLSIFDDTLRFIDSFILRHNYENEIIKIKDKLYLFGSNYKDPWHQLEEYYLVDVYKLNAIGKYDYERSKIKVWKFPKFLSKDFAGIPKYSVLKKNNILFILYTYLPEVILYNTEDETISTITINFPTYTDPINVNFKKYNKKAEKKWGLKYFPDFIFSFYPEYFWYDSNNERFIAQFGRPYQLIKKSDNKDRYIIVIFDKDFNFQGSIYTDKLLLLCHNEENKTKMFMIWLPNFNDPNYIEPEEYFIEEYELMEEKHEK